MCEDGEDVTDVDWPAHTFKSVGALADERDIKRRQDAADLAARKCACGNFKTPGHVDGLCNACRSKAAPSPSTSAASKVLRPTGSPRCPSRRKAATRRRGRGIWPERLLFVQARASGLYSTHKPRGAARHGRRRQSPDLGLGGMAGGRPRPRAGAIGATVGRPGGEPNALDG